MVYWVLLILFSNVCCHPAAELNEVFICSVTVWRVLVLPAKRTAWSTWNWKREELRWILQTPAIRGKEWIGIGLKWIEMDSVHWTLGLRWIAMYLPWQ